MKESQQKKFDTHFGTARLLLLLLHLVAILSNFQDQVSDSTTQTQAIATHFPETAIGDEKSVAIVKDFRAGCTLGLMFTIMQLIVLYVGTNRFRLKPTAFALTLHFVGLWLYLGHGRWLFENIWSVVAVFSFIPAVSEIAVALYTAKK